MRGLLFGTLLLALSAPTYAQTVWYVDADASGTASGASWTDAFPDLQPALAAAQPGDTLWIAEGSYMSQQSFVISSSISIFGGFSGDETLLSERDWQAHPTILRGLGYVPAVQIAGTHIRLDGLVLRNYMWTVLLLSGEHIEIANTTVEHSPEVGIHITEGNHSLHNVIARSNNRGIQIDRGDVQIYDSYIFNNSLNGIIYNDLSESGAGLNMLAGTLHAERVLFLNNRITWGYESVQGGGAHIHAGTATFIETQFILNSIFDPGGNVIGSGGGGLSTYLWSNVSLLRCAFFGNFAEAYRDPWTNNFSLSGGALLSRGSLLCANCIFVGNQTLSNDEAYGGAIYTSGNATLVQSTLIDNIITGTDVSGAAISAIGDFSLFNSIVWRNHGTDELSVGDDAILEWNIVEGGYPSAPTVFDIRPGFIGFPHPGADSTWSTLDDDYGDLRLRHESPAIDLGDATRLPPDTFDLDGDGDTTEPLPFDYAGALRVQGAAVDLGAYEGGVHVMTEPSGALPTTLTLRGAYPNPFNPAARIVFDLPRDAEVTLRVFDALGRRVLETAPQRMTAGAARTLALDGRGLASGVYVYGVTAQAGEETWTASGQVTLLR